MLRTRSVRPSQIGPCFLSSRGERAIVDQRVADGVDAARGAQRLGAHQHAAAGRARHRVVRPVHPGERIEHLEEEDEGRDVHALGQVLAAQRAMSEVRTSRSASRLRDQPLSVSGA